MERGSLVSAAFSRDLGRPRPALVIQADAYQLSSVALLPITSHLQAGVGFRIDLLPSDGNGLKCRSQIMVDKLQSVSRERMGAVLGRVDPDTQRKVDLMLLLFLGLA